MREGRAPKSSGANPLLLPIICSSLLSFPMAKRSTIPSAHARVMHASKRDMHGRFLPEHERCFPARPTEATTENEPAATRTDYPGTGTPNVIRQAHLQEEAFERSERISAGGHIVPSRDRTEWIEAEEDDWLDKDARH